MQCDECGFRLHGQQARPAEFGTQGGVGGHPLVCPGAPGDTGRRQILTAPVLGKCVQARVGRRVVRLAGCSKCAGDGGEQHERGQVVCAGQLVEVDRGLGLGAEHGGEPLGVHADERAVVEDACRVEDAGQRLVFRDGGEKLRQCVAVCGVAGGERGTGAVGGEVGDEVLGSWGVGASPADEQQMFGAFLGQLAGERGADGAGASGDQRGAGRGPGGPVGLFGAGGPDQPAGEQAGGTDGELIAVLAVVTRGVEHRTQSVQGAVVESVRQVDEAGPVIGVFDGRGTAEAPEGGLRRGAEPVGAAGADGAPGCGPQPDGGVGADERLDERTGQDEGGGGLGVVGVTGGAEAEEGEDVDLVRVAVWEAGLLDPLRDVVGAGVRRQAHGGHGRAMPGQRGGEGVGDGLMVLRVRGGDDEQPVGRCSRGGAGVTGSHCSAYRQVRAVECCCRSRWNAASAGTTGSRRERSRRRLSASSGTFCCSTAVQKAESAGRLSGASSGTAALSQ